MKNFKIKFAVLVSILGAGIFVEASAGIKGHIDGVFKQGSQYNIRGWACQTGENQSVNVHLYVGGAAGSGKFVRSITANLSSETAVANACGADGSRYRFKFFLSNQEIIDHGGKSIYVHGISPLGTGNLAINRSGIHSMPNDILLSNFLKNQPEGEVTIPSHLEVISDYNGGNGVTYNGIITVNGTLRCARTTKSYSLDVEGIVVAGAEAVLECGTESNPFMGDMEFNLSGETFSGDMGVKAIVAMDGGVISLHGKSGNEGTYKLSTTVNVGDTQIYLDKAPNWSVGDEIVIASSGFDPYEAEKHIIAEIEGNLITLSNSVDHLHWGETESFTNFIFPVGGGEEIDISDINSWVLDERAEVVNLSRNIKIQPSNKAEADASEIGAHMMIMGEASAGYINNVEFTHVGQKGIMGRYPFHWHLKGDVSGQYIKNSSIHRSYSRCVTIHGTNNSIVENNACYDHFGHGFFMEGGNETGNIIQDNIGILTKRVLNGKELLVSDVHVKPSVNGKSNIYRFAAPATFWITNPNNTIRRNIAAGSEGAGFWMSFMPQLLCDDNGCDFEQIRAKANVFPADVNLDEFSSNTAHSSVVGITFDGIPIGDETGNTINTKDRYIKTSPYTPTEVPTFENLMAYKNSRTGLYYRGQRAIFNNAILADNAVSFFVTYDQELVNSLVVGLSENSCDTGYFEDENVRELVKDPYRFLGVKIYDGPFYIKSTHFARFDDIYTRNTWAGCSAPAKQPVVMRLSGAAGRYTNRVEDLSFRGIPKTKLHMDELAVTDWKHDAHSAAVLDIDGSMSGHEGKLIRPFNSMNNHQECSSLDASLGYIDALACDHRISHLKIKYANPENIEGIVTNRTKIAVTRINDYDEHDRASVSYSGNEQYNKISMIMGEQFDYRIDSLDRSYGGQLRNTFELKFSSESAGDISPVINFENIDESCKIYYRIAGANSLIRSTSSLSDLSVAQEPIYYRNGKKLYFKLEAKSTFNKNRRTDTYNGFSNYRLICSDGSDSEVD